MPKLKNAACLAISSAVRAPRGTSIIVPKTYSTLTPALASTALASPSSSAFVAGAMPSPGPHTIALAPAAKTLHHAYIGGLLDHVVSLFRSCDLLCRNYPQVNRDLLLTGAFLHDVGKIHELTYNRSFSYSTRGQLLGHMIIELEMLQTKLEQLPGFPADLKTLLEHLIISHHGQYEFGSPKLPMFPEALMLHYLDDLDSKMEAMRAHFEREAQLNGPWTSYNPSMGRPLLNSAKFLRAEAAEDPVVPAPPEPESEPSEPSPEEQVVDLFGEREGEHNGEHEGKTEPAVAGITPRPAKF